MKYTKLLLVLVLAAILLISCSKEEKPENKPVDEEIEETKDENTQDEEKGKEQELDPEVIAILEGLPDVPNDSAGVINQSQGRFAMSSADWNEQKYEELYEEFEKVGALPNEATSEQLEQYFKFLYSIVAYDFPDPQDTIKKWEFGSYGDPDLPDSRFHFKDNYNIEVLLDGSGSMGAYIGDKTMMQIAKESINDFLKNVPEEANVSFRVYGHKGTGSNEDKKLSCESIEQVYGYDSYDEKAFQKELDKIQPSGWTPLAKALKQAEAALKEFDTEQNTNLIYVVSDGVETCDGDPVQVAKSLSESNAKPIINIIGFNVDTDAQKQLKEMADVSGGIFATASDQEELEEEFKRAEKVLEAWEEWKEDALGDAESNRVNNNFDILSVINDWNSKEQRMINNLSTVIKEASEKNLINSKQKEYMMTRRSEVGELLSSVKRDVEADLKQISAQTIEDMKKAIEEKYEKNTSQ